MAFYSVHFTEQLFCNHFNNQKAIEYVAPMLTFVVFNTKTVAFAAAFAIILVKISELGN
jgi:hypothetical protein